MLRLNERDRSRRNQRPQVAALNGKSGKPEETSQQDRPSSTSDREHLLRDMLGRFQLEVCSDERAQEIATLAEIDLATFIELTGIQSKTYGIYELTLDGVLLKRTLLSLDDDSPIEQVKLARAKGILQLAFPCTPQECMAWNQATNRDVPLPKAFLRALATSPSRDRSRAATSEEIERAFRVIADASKNNAWWKQRMRDAKKYHLDHARLVAGRGKRQSIWDSLAVAAWLLDRRHMTASQLKATLREHFPKVDADFLNAE